MVKAMPAGGMEWVADEHNDPADIAASHELAREVWARLRRRGDPPTHYITGSGVPWSPEVIWYTVERRCPLCAGPHPGGATCVVCSANSADPRRRAMQDREPPRREPAPLAGAVAGRKARLRGGRG